MASLNDIRSSFLGYFERNGHRIVPSSPLVPRNDPTLMFTNAGMVQFKNLFTGVEHRDYRRAVTAQKCVRAGGKHNDLDNVGHTARHHTFFEMLGNFSFGDYFKELAIPLAWELLTREFGIDPARLLVTVYHTDDEAAEIWRKVTGFGDDRILRIATSDNFWTMGATGPCGPCSEIFYDHGPKVWGGPPGSADENGDRFIEIWNIVFMQQEQFADGTRRDLEARSIDTGMGLERIGAVLQGKHDNYDTDLMRSLIEASASVSGTDPDGAGKVHHRVIADHLRSTSFLIADGVMPSNEGRGYVLRRILRRAARHAHLLGTDAPVMYRLVGALVRQMGAAYPELVRAQPLIEETLKYEEEKFRQTLERGLRLLEDEVARLPEGGPLPGEAAFRLYDTYGFPLDLTQDALRDLGRSVDTDGFDAAMEAQKARARASWAGSGEARDARIWFDLAEREGMTEFLGHDTEAAEGVILALVRDGVEITAASAGEDVQVVVNQTPFYAESGGQVGDSGWIRTDSGLVEITDTRKAAGVFIHIGRVSKGEVRPGEPARLEVAHARRAMIRANHSATHLLNEALRRALGDHVAQKGSLNAAERLRFDFSHHSALAPGQIAAVEDEVNDYIRQNTPVGTRVMTPEAARALGAQALFGEKYGEEVRVVSMGARDGSGKGADGRTYSIELCGGTHVARTGDIGAFVILGDSASSAGVRRIEALTGAAALAHLRDEGARLAEVAAVLKAPAGDVVVRVRALMDERRALEGELARARRDLAMGGGAAGAAVAGEEILPGLSFQARRLSGVGGKDLPPMMDEIRQSGFQGITVLGAEQNGKAALAVANSAPAFAHVSAVEVLRAAVAALGGRGGGGRPDLAQGGAPGLDAFDAAVEAARERIRQLAGE